MTHYIQATRTIEEITTLPPLSSSDAGSLIVFLDTDLNVYYANIEQVLTADSVRLYDGVGLPLEDVNITQLFILSGEKLRIYSDYIAEIKSLIKDEEGKLTAEDLDAVLQKALIDWANDAPVVLKKKINGNGTNKYNLADILGTSWVDGYSEIISIEYPYGEEPPMYLSGEDYSIYDDGENLQLVLFNDTPSSDESFVIEYTTEPVMNAVTPPNFKNTKTNFSAITTLAAAYACQRLAAAYAQSIDANIQADVVNYNDKSNKYTSLSREYFKLYNKIMSGDEATSVSISPSINTTEIKKRGLFH